MFYIKDQKTIDNLLVDACLRSNFGAVQFLVEEGANVDYVDFFENLTPLCSSAHHADIDIMEYLLFHKADPNLTSKKAGYMTALHIASKAANNRLEAVKLLLNYDASPSAKDENGYTAYDYALHHEKICEQHNTVSSYLKSLMRALK